MHSVVNPLGSFNVDNKTYNVVNDVTSQGFVFDQGLKYYSWKANFNLKKMSTNNFGLQKLANQNIIEKSINPNWVLGLGGSITPHPVGFSLITQKR